MIYRKEFSAGFSLIEVLVALLIFSLGLIGLAGLLVMSTQANNGALIRTQATFLAQNMADRMRANIGGVWEGDYDDTWPISATAPACDAASPCKPADLATRDKVIWGDMLKQFMPDDSNLTASVACNSPTAGALVASVPDFYAKRPPYQGMCTMHISWTERSLAIGGSAAKQTFDWVFQP